MCCFAHLLSFLNEADVARFEEFPVFLEISGGLLSLSKATYYRFISPEVIKCSKAPPHKANFAS